ncbi:glycosyltransferase family 2 protein [Paraburkholderia bannensis]|uniref:hypothetical protein n=1 Tax=Paraburkholderia bannensis TaxID=765414 RepID=UPI002AC37284|nr:hypothetical protein [Paraburkholderia bannensis]
MSVFYLTPWKTGDIGGGINESVALLPADAWVCVRDGDTLFLTPDWGTQIEQIILRNAGRFDVIGAMTNRIRSAFQLHGGALSENGDIGYHREIARQRWRDYGASVGEVPGPLAGMCLIFHRSVWERVPFEPYTIYFDKRFCARVREHGGRLGVAHGLYLFHVYRWGELDPVNSIDHLK